MYQFQYFLIIQQLYILVKY